MKKFKEFLENYDPYLDDPSQLRPDGTRKGKGWLGTFKNAKGEDVSEYSISVPTEELLDLNLPRGTILHKPETHIPTLVPDLTDEEIGSVVKGTETGENPSDAVVNKAFSHARNQLLQGRSQYR